METKTLIIQENKKRRGRNDNNNKKNGSRSTFLFSFIYASQTRNYVINQEIMIGLFGVVSFDSCMKCGLTKEVLRIVNQGRFEEKGMALSAYLVRELTAISVNHATAKKEIRYSYSEGQFFQREFFRREVRRK